MKNVKVLFSTFVVILTIVLFIGCNVPVEEDDDSGGGGVVVPLGPAAVNLGNAVNYTILAKATITTTGTPATSVVGDIGISPAAATLITGFGLVMDGSGTFSTSALIVGGRIYASNYTAPTPANMILAITDMETAYTDAAGRTATPANTNLGAGNIGGLTFVPGVYKWTTAVTIPTDITLNGAADDTWIFQLDGTLNMASDVDIILTGGAQAKNIVWQVAGAVTLNTNAHFEGIVLTATAVNMTAGATVTGRLFAQTAVTLISNTITRP